MNANAMAPAAQAAALDLACRLAVKQLPSFVRLVWPVLNPGRALVWNKHHDALCKHAEALLDGRIRHLLCNLPPGYTKTTIFTICLPMWRMLTRPSLRVICASYSHTLASKAAKERVKLLRSPIYQRLAATAISMGTPEWEFTGLTIREIETSRSGFVLATSVGGEGLGRHADLIVVDDPNKAQDVYTVRLAQAIEWFDETLRTRVTDVSSTAFLVVMQRLSAADLCGRLVKDPLWTHLCLPAEFDPTKRCETSIGWSDWRTEEGELLFPERFPQEWIDHEKGPFGIGSIGFSAQQNQDPVSGSGNVFHREWFRFWTDDESLPPDTEETENGIDAWYPEEVDEILASWDLTFKSGAGTDFVCGQIWARVGAKCFLLEQVHARLGFVETRAAFRKMARKWTIEKKCLIRRWLVEEAANGAAIIDELRHEVSGLVPVKARESKIARAQAVSTMVEAGLVYLPYPGLVAKHGKPRFNFVNSFLDELTAFPLSEYDDQVDATSMALRDLRERAMRHAAWTQPRLKPRTHKIPDPIHDFLGEKPRRSTFIPRSRKARQAGPALGLKSAHIDPNSPANK